MGVDAAHSAPAPARDRLDEHRIADLIGLFAQEFRVLVVAMIAGHDRHAGPLHQRLGRAFQAHRPHRLGRGADEDDAGLCAGFGEIGVLGQESVAWVQTFGADCFRQREDRGLIEITVRALADLMRFVGKAGEKRPAIDRRVKGDRLHPHPPRGANDAAGDLAAVGDEDVGEHVRLRPPCLYRTRIRMASGARLSQVQSLLARCASRTDPATASRLRSHRPSGVLSPSTANLGSLSSWTGPTFAATFGAGLCFVEQARLTRPQGGVSK